MAYDSFALFGPAGKNIDVSGFAILAKGHPGNEPLPALFFNFDAVDNLHLLQVDLVDVSAATGHIQKLLVGRESRVAGGARDWDIGYLISVDIDNLEHLVSHVKYQVFGLDSAADQCGT